MKFIVRKYIFVCQEEQLTKWLYFFETISIFNDEQISGILSEK